MALRYVIKARAQREIERLARWWQENRAAAPGHVRLDLEAVLFVLTHHPGIGQEVETGRPVPVRRYLMSRTRHWLYYRVRHGVLEELSVWSTSREPGPRL